MNDRLPTSTNIRFNIGDHVVFRDGKDGKRHDARIVGFEGMNALLKWGNMDRKVPERELIPSYEVHQEIEEDTTPTEPGREKEDIGSSIASEQSDTGKEEKGSETSLKDQDEDSDTEIITEIRPKRRGPKRKKLEIIPEIVETRIVRQEKRSRQAQHENNQQEQPTREPWSEDEEKHTTKNPYLTRPKRWKHVNMWNLWGEKFSGCVLDVEKGNRKRFRIQEHGTLAVLGIDLDNLNYWEYTNKPDSGGLALDSGDNASQQALQAEHFEDENTNSNKFFCCYYD